VAQRKRLRTERTPARARAARAVTIRDIARLCGVSIATVSRVVNDAGGVGARTADHVRKVIEEHDFHPNSVAQSLITKRTHTIGLVIPDVRNPFFSELARGVEDACNANAFGCLLCNTDGSIDKESEYVRVLRGRVADGAIFTTQNVVEHSDALLSLRNRSYPFCFVERYVDEMPDVPGVYFDNEAGALEMMRFIFGRGHRRIAFISGPLSTHNARMRKQGYLRALEQHGIRVDEKLIVEGNYRYSGGYQATERLLDGRKPKFTALFASNDLMALGAYQFLEERGLRVPADVSIAGFDNIGYPAVMRPLITTIEIPAYELGKSATDMLFSLLEGRKVAPLRRVFRPVLRDKGSVLPLDGSEGARRRRPSSHTAARAHPVKELP
jgi:LacI family transcriptional regulator